MLAFILTRLPRQWRRWKKALHLQPLCIAFCVAATTGVVKNIATAEEMRFRLSFLSASAAAAAALRKT